jgi:hypothetical protein
MKLTRSVSTLLTVLDELVGVQQPRVVLGHAVRRDIASGSEPYPSPVWSAIRRSFPMQQASAVDIPSCNRPTIKQLSWEYLVDLS